MFKWKLILALVMAALASGCAWSPEVAEPAPVRPTPPTPEQRPAITATEMIRFNEKQFHLGYRGGAQQVPVYEYFLPNESAANWSQLVGFRVYPPLSGDNSPLAHAQGTAALFRDHFPDIEFALYEDAETGTAMLDVLVPAGDERPQMEFNVFKFFPDPDTDRMISFHYARRLSERTHVVQGPNATQALRQELLPEMAAFPLYRYRASE